MIHQITLNYPVMRVFIALAFVVNFVVVAFLVNFAFQTSHFSNSQNKRPHTLEQVYRDLHLDNLSIAMPKNLHLVLMGDSLTRYQYLDLAYFLAHSGSWTNPDDRPNIVLEKTHSDWNSFYNFTNTKLHPYENCDCFRNADNFSHAVTVENRYFLDMKNNNSVTYLQKFGSLPFKSSWPVSDVHNPHELLKDQSNMSFVHEWNWVDTVRNFVCKMNPKPSVFIFNSGFWPDDELSQIDVQLQIISALRDCQIKSMYKTTTETRDGNKLIADETREKLCSSADACLNTSWTRFVPLEKYWDDLHFVAPIYSLLNVHMLRLLAGSSGVDFFE